MTHYTVTVVLDGEKAGPALARGEKLDVLLEEALAPFNEELEAPRHVNMEWTWAEGESPFGADPTGQKRGLSYVDEEVRKANTWEALYLYLRDDDETFEFDPEARTLKEFTTYNPLSRWDWWVVGGRWQNYFQSMGLGTGANFVLVGDLDTDAMEEKNLARDMATYDMVRSVVGDAEYVPWSWHVEKVDADEWSIEEARTAYRNQEANRRVRAAGKQNTDLIWIDLDDYMISRETFEENVRNAAVPTYALLTKEGEWVEPGRMGWWGMSSDTPDTKADYQKQYMAYLDTLNPTDVLVCVDVHI